jgi:ectoine hydroxylase-related dioxygenase (phytanoyl-CoA dioxygenase family)
LVLRQNPEPYSDSIAQMASGGLFDPKEYCARIHELGFAIVTQVLEDSELDTIISDLSQSSQGQSSRHGKTYAVRNLLASSQAVAYLAQSEDIRALVQAVLESEPFPVRAILFDKVPEANWPVAWHQDQFIPADQRLDVPGFTSWSIKKGVPHVRPPVTVLERMLTLRIHLDDCSADNGALKVVPGSHKLGLLTEERIRDMVAASDVTVCAATRGSVLAMRPLLLHASGSAVSPFHRRVIHLEYAADRLPGGLKWPRWKLD